MDKLLTSTRIVFDMYKKREVAKFTEDLNEDWMQSVMNDNEEYAVKIGRYYDRVQLTSKLFKNEQIEASTYFVKYRGGNILKDPEYKLLEKSRDWAQQNYLIASSDLTEAQDDPALANLLNEQLTRATEQRTTEIAAFTVKKEGEYAVFEAQTLADLLDTNAESGAEVALEYARLGSIFEMSATTAIVANVVAIGVQVLIELALFDNTNYRAYRLFIVQPQTTL